MGDPNDKLVADTLSFTDKVEYFLVPQQLIIIDGLSFSDVVGQPIMDQPHDQLFFVDQVKVALGTIPVGRIEVSVGDLLNFKDSVNERAPYSKSLSDSISLSDLIQVLVGLSFPVSDSITIADALALIVVCAVSSSDTLSFSDSVQVSLGGTGALSESISDSIILFDSVQVNLNPNGASLLFGDALSFTDQVDVVLESYGTSYLRRYLNDVI